MSALCEGELKARKKAKAQAFCQSSCLVSFWKSASSLSNFVCVCVCVHAEFSKGCQDAAWRYHPEDCDLSALISGMKCQSKNILKLNQMGIATPTSLYMLLLPLRPKRIPRRCWTFLHSCSCGVIIFLSICQYMHVPSWSGNQGF